MYAEKEKEGEIEDTYTYMDIWIHEHIQGVYRYMGLSIHVSVHLWIKIYMVIVEKLPGHLDVDM